MVADVPLDLKTLHSNVMFDKISSKITILVIADDEGECMWYVCETTTTSNSIRYT